MKRGSSVRPVRLEGLLEAVHAIDRGDAYDVPTLRRQLNCSPGRARDIERALFHTSLIERPEGQFCATPNFHKLVAMWEEGDALGISGLLHAQFPPYRRFLEGLREAGSIEVTHGSQQGEDKLTTARAFMDDLGLNRGSFDILWRMAVALGAAYVVADEVFYGANSPDYHEFEDAVLQTAQKSHVGYVGIDEIADTVCPALQIGLPTFERLFAHFYRRNKERLSVSSSFVGGAEGRLLYTLPPRTQRPWVVSRYLADGVTVDGVHIRVFKVRYT